MLYSPLMDFSKRTFLDMYLTEAAKELNIDVFLVTLKELVSAFQKCTWPLCPQTRFVLVTWTGLRSPHSPLRLAPADLRPSTWKGLSFGAESSRDPI